MIEAHAPKTQHLINRQLFSQACLQAWRAENFSHDTIIAEKQTMREWREAYPHLEDDVALLRYVSSCLSTLRLSYSIQASNFTLYADASKVKSVGICLVVNDTDLGRTTKGKHHQANLIKRLRDASLRWGIVTNGRRWRLCYAEAAAPYEVFLEMDLDTLLEMQDLSEYYLFHLLFGQAAFTTAFQMSDRKVAETGLDQHLKESEKRIEAVQRYLRNRVESILQALCLGFVQDEAAGSYTREMLDEIYRNAIYLLYRILFLFYAESRELLPILDVSYQRISLTSIVEDARLQQQVGEEAYDSFSLWKCLTHLFVVVDYGDDSVGVRPYNGGLFSDREKPYLKDHRIANMYLAPALFELGYIQGKTGITPIDYSDLSVRHLGTLYEGLLEYRLNLVEHERVIVRDQKNKRTFIPISMAGTVKRIETILEVGQVYFADYKGERKSSGSYYTPEDVVQYIVANTVLPVLQKRRQSIENFLGQLQSELVVAANREEQIRLERYADQEILAAVERDMLSLRMLDPAMGSAHFLVAAGQVATNFIVETLNLTEWVSDFVDSDPLIWKRRVVERCLYGVDLNPLAYELAKLALWLNSASAGKPLTFLDHHLKVGNSLYSTPLSRLSTLPTAKKASTGTGDLWETLHQEMFRDILATLGEITGKDSDDIQDVKQKGKAYRDANDLVQRLRDIANVWLGTLFGLHNGYGKPVIDIEYQNLLAEATRNYAPATWEQFVNTTATLRTARDLAHPDNQCFFHWELEFPDAVVDGKCQFDVIIANPPYVGTSPNRAISELYETAKGGDLYAWLFERSLCMATDTGNIGLIIPLSLMFSRQMKPLRKLLLQEEATLFISSFDATRDGIFLPNGESRNGQRASIAVCHKQKDKHQIHTTNLMRWISEERPALFSSLNYAEITLLATEEVFPKLGDPRLVQFLQELRDYSKTVGSTMYRSPKRKPGEKIPPPPPLYHLYVPRFARYFITALPMAIRNRGLHVLGWEKEWTRDIAMVALNSNIFYWLWCALGDGFDVTADNIEMMVIPAVPEDDLETLYLRDTLLNIAEECITYQNKEGMRIPNYNFNKRMDVLIDIDKWLVRHIAPNLTLPRDIFAQYKSNSFLRPLDLSEIIQTEAEENLVMEVEE